MKIAVVTPVPWLPRAWSLDLNLWLDPLREAGHAVEVVGPLGSEPAGASRFRGVTTESLEASGFWCGLRYDLALVYTWMGRPALLRAMRSAGTAVVAVGDTDGQLGVRCHPVAQLQRMWLGQRTLGRRLRAGCYWLKRYWFLYRREDAEVVAALALAAATLVPTATARAALRPLLQRAGREDLAAKLVVVPHLISPAILSAPVARERGPLVVALGRWDDEQKAAPLLAATLELFLARQAIVQVVIMGGGGAAHFGPLARRHPGLQYLGRVPHPEVGAHLARAQVCLITSRWESFHLAGHELLCLGGTLVGPGVIPLPDVCGAGPFGTMSASRHPARLAAALESELRAWRSGQRDPVRIAAYWRQRLATRAAVEAVLRLGAREANLVA